MKLNLKNGFDIHIGGEVAKDNSLPLDYFAKICTAFQDLVNEVAKNSLQTETIDLNNFKIELTGFFKGSAVPRFEMTNRIQTVIHGNTEKQKTLVSNKIDQLLALTATGGYRGITDLYQVPQASNAIVESFYGFMSSFGTAPVEFGKYNISKGTFNSTYKAKKFRPSVRDQLLVTIKPSTEEGIEEYRTIGSITVKSRGGKLKRKIDKVFSTPGVIAAYNPSEITVNGKKYLTHGLLAEFIREDDYFVLKSDLLDIVGTGDTEEEAKVSFAEEIDYIYTRYLGMEDDQLSDRLIEIKRILPAIIKLAKSHE